MRTVSAKFNMENIQGTRPSNKTVSGKQNYKDTWKWKEMSECNSHCSQRNNLPMK